MILSIQNLSFSFGKKKILDNFSLTLNSNEIVTLTGRSGIGKTTLFKILTGILVPESGSVTFSDKHRIAYMPQEDILLPWRTVLQNLLLPAELGKQIFSLGDLRKEAQEILSEVGLEHYADVYPDQLSGGMRQRVGLARALLQKCQLFLLDEPFNGLDIALREQICSLLCKVKDKLGCTIFIITHDVHDIFSLSDRILLMHEGAIQTQLAPLRGAGWVSRKIF